MGGGGRYQMPTQFGTSSGANVVSPAPQGVKLTNPLAALYQQNGNYKNPGNFAPGSSLGAGPGGTSSDWYGDMANNLNHDASNAAASFANSPLTNRFPANLTR